MDEDSLIKLLRSKGYKESPDGNWGKQGVAPRTPGGGTDPKSNPKRALADKPRKKKQDAQGHRLGSQAKAKAKSPAKPANDYRRCVILVEIHTVRPRDYDGAGAATKGMIDRLVEVGAIPVPDDSPDWLEVVFDLRKCNHFKDQKTILEVFALPKLHY